MPDLKQQLESILLVTSKPISCKKLAEVLSVKPKEVEAALILLVEDYSSNNRGIRLILNNEQAQLASSPENAALVKQYLKDDLTGELTEPSVETLTIIAYRQPITKAELEQIRGINCSLIIRNLMIRGLVEAEYDKARATTLYSATVDFLKYLGLESVSQLPDFEKLNSDENLNKLIQQENTRVESNQEKIIKVEVKKE